MREREEKMGMKKERKKSALGHMGTFQTASQYKKQTGFLAYRQSTLNTALPIIFLFYPASTR